MPKQVTEFGLSGNEIRALEDQIKQLKIETIQKTKEIQGLTVEA